MARMSSVAHRGRGPCWPSFPPTVPPAGAPFPPRGLVGSIPPLRRYYETLRLLAAHPPARRRGSGPYMPRLQTGLHHAFEPEVEDVVEVHIRHGQAPRDGVARRAVSGASSALARRWDPHRRHSSETSQKGDHALPRKVGPTARAAVHPDRRRSRRREAPGASARSWLVGRRSPGSCSLSRVRGLPSRGGQSDAQHRSLRWPPERATRPVGHGHRHGPGQRRWGDAKARHAVHRGADRVGSPRCEHRIPGPRCHARGDASVSHQAGPGHPGPQAPPPIRPRWSPAVSSSLRS